MYTILAADGFGSREGGLSAAAIQAEPRNVVFFYAALKKCCLFGRNFPTFPPHTGGKNELGEACSASGQENKPIVECM